ncbi:pyrophosphate--fructose 6-phosphate 1-phosphotransferase [Deltaproteobacteria bacterium]|nr:pyrophosphate--fructose 6-phosphate 1-phosphotransferase [Deltaproteobacteria bacterium]
MTFKIGVLTGGGDCAGLNSAVKWVTKTATDPQLAAHRGEALEVIGLREGWKSLVEVQPDDPDSLVRWTTRLDELVVRTWDRQGGTVLGSSRTNPFNPNNNQSERCLANIRALGLHAVVAIGGEDTLSVAYKLHNLGQKMVGIPKTIDRDLNATDYTLGYDTALNVITEEVDRLRTTAGSHSRLFVVEVMGRHAGWLALEGGEAAGAHVILIPEYEFEVAKVAELLERRRQAGVRYDIVVVSEGARIKGQGELYLSDKEDGFGHKVLGGIGEYLARQLESATGYETRHVVLSHIQRGGQPSARDRLMGRYFGIAAVDLILEEDFGRMVSFRNGEITSVSLKQALEKLYVVDVGTLYDPTRYNGRRSSRLPWSSRSE